MVALVSAAQGANLPWKDTDVQETKAEDQS